MNAIKYLAIALFFFVSSPVIACKLSGLEQFIEFKERETTIGKSTARSVALWFIERRDIGGISSVLVFTHYDVNDINTKNISAERLRNISKLLAPLVGDVNIEFINWPKKPKSKAAEKYYFNTLGISIQPKCMETDSCCGGNMR
ncbi:hypothetical protein HS961_18510 [Comamonas piscis]|uniref:Uncharacterized protein n=1 Tax=Comamonas piscis TaxID=1562974 RepID=A0A7G5EKZ1_9BURK|nr:hypothetical protein [Comamonas piscis]QMV74666.1 hypothetical protein HS961_18510 [Comamonas piscis]WSO33130.1 hypothetical protein VUJ63_18570 [Comamonas piscis]